MSWYLPVHVAHTACAGIYAVVMKNITLSLDDDLLEAGREYAQRHQMTLNGLVRELLVKTVLADRLDTVREMFRLMDVNPGNSRARRWKTRRSLWRNSMTWVGTSLMLPPSN